MKFKFKLGFIGFGNMATAILSGILQSGVLKLTDIIVFDYNDSAKENAKKLGVIVASSNADLVENAEFVFFAVKPQAFDDVAKEIADSFSIGNKIISILAGTKISAFQKYFKNIPIARAMPNTPALIKRGMTGIDVAGLENRDGDFVLKLFNCIGDVIEIDESQINDVIAISGSGPAYVYLFIKGMVEKAKSLGFSDEIAKKLVIKTVVGSAGMFENATENIDVLIERVCSRGGTTIEAVNVFKNDGLIELIDKAIQACHDRAVEMSKDKI